MEHMVPEVFQSTLPRGSDTTQKSWVNGKGISIHAPSRERRCIMSINFQFAPTFQSTLPRGSDYGRSGYKYYGLDISIHAPSRERRNGRTIDLDFLCISIHAPSRERQSSVSYCSLLPAFQSTLPRGSDSIKTNYFSIHLNQAFFAN